MGLTRADRFRLRSALVDLLNQDFNHWDFDRRNMLLGEFGLPQLESDYGDPTFGQVIGKASDADLAEMYSIVSGQAPGELTDESHDLHVAPWSPGRIRLFISHSAIYKGFVGQVARRLASVGVHGFVAHDTMENAKPFQDQIEQALSTMDVFVALVHKEFNESPWCQQEIGWACGRRVPVYAIRFGANPQAFAARDQWPSKIDKSAREVADEIAEWISGLPAFGDRFTEALFSALESAGDYESAGAAARRIAALQSLTRSQWDRLASIYHLNAQVHNGILANRELRPLYVAHKQVWPPAKPTSNDEVPF